MTGRIFSGGCRKASPVFVAREIRCRFGHVQVQVCRPWGRKVFPTSFWLTCPYLVRLAGNIESSGGVHELEEYIMKRGLVHEWRRYNLMHQVIRLKLGGVNVNAFMRRYRGKIFRDVMCGGVGGIRVGEGVNVKCLHLQTASLIGTGHHTAGEWLKSRGLWGDCGNGLCNIFAGRL
ncbi:MAG: DUF501 domain-containing protein [Synergistaceae bacterium]|nr:DUF501 domain-containing protein [Synergistaceae bacterium]